MKILSRVWAWLTSAAARGPRKAHPDLAPIDVDRIAKDLGLVEAARRLGEAGLPSEDATVLSGPEAEVVQRVEKARQDYVDWGALRLNVLNTDLSRKNITKDINRARQADQEFSRRASALLAEKESVVRDLGSTARKRLAELDAFKVEHGLVREARVPTSSRAFFNYALLLLLVLLEGFVNANFFSKGLDSGLVGGFIEAGVLAAVNVAIAFVLGKAIVPYANHSRPTLKVFGVLGLVAALAVIAFMGLGIAHYRDSLTSGAENAATAALTAFRQHPFQLNDVFSWFLFIATIGFGLAALVDGLLSGDTYPGYGAVTVRAQEATDDLEADLSELRAALEALKNEELEALDLSVQQAQTDVAVYETLIHNKQLTGSRLTTALMDADNSLDALLKKFRTENEVHRNGVKRPAYFETQPALKAVRRPDLSTQVEEASVLNQRALVASLLSEVQDIRGRIQAAFTQQFDRLKPLDTHFPAKEGS